MLRLLNLDSFPHKAYASTFRTDGTTFNKFTGFDNVPYKGVEHACVWDVKDGWMLRKYYNLLRIYRKASRSLMSWNPWKAMSFEAMYNTLMNDYDKAFTAHYNDHRNVKWWNNVSFEPHLTDIIDNQVMWQGMAHFIKLGAGITSEFIDYMAIGTALNAPAVIPSNRQTLYDEKSRESASRTGAITADGNTFRISASFSPTIETCDIKEYGGFSKVTGGIMFFIAIGNRALPQKQGETIIQTTHYVIFTSKVT